MKILLNVVLYQVIWFSCVVGGNTGAMFSLPVLGFHLAITQNRIADLKMMGFLLFLGLLVDGTLQQVGFFTFTTSGFPIPFWLMVIWLGLAITPLHSLRWLQNRPLLSGLFGALGGPAAYWAGVRLGAASFSWSTMSSLAVLALVWALVWPLVMYFGLLLTVDLPEEDGKQ